MDELIRDYMEGNDNFYSKNSADFMGMVLIESEPVYGRIIKGSTIVEGNCSFDKKNKNVSVETLGGTIIIEYPFVFEGIYD